MLALLCILFASITIQSDNGQYTADLSYDNGYNLGEVTFRLRDESGVLFYTKRNLAAQTFFVSNFGTVFAVNDNTLYCYNKYGDDTVLKTLDCANGFSFSPDNTLFFASDKAGVFIYSYAGSLVYKLNPGRLVACTDKGEQIAVISSDTLSVYEEGVLQLTIELPTPYIYALEFIDEGSCIKVQTSSGTLFFNAYSRRDVE